MFLTKTHGFTTTPFDFSRNNNNRRSRYKPTVRYSYVSVQHSFRFSICFNSESHRDSARFTFVIDSKIVLVVRSTQFFLRFRLISNCDSVFTVLAFLWFWLNYRFCYNLTLIRFWYKCWFELKLKKAYNIKKLNWMNDYRVKMKKNVDFVLACKVFDEMLQSNPFFFSLLFCFWFIATRIMSFSVVDCCWIMVMVGCWRWWIKCCCYFVLNSWRWWW